jgi:hypothetical protein
MIYQHEARGADQAITDAIDCRFPGSSFVLLRDHLVATRRMR